MTGWRNRLASAVNTAKHIKAIREGPAPPPRRMWMSMDGYAMLVEEEEE
jgi:hypothetical protein